MPVEGQIPAPGQGAILRRGKEGIGLMNVKIGVWETAKRTERKKERKKGDYGYSGNPGKG